MTNRVFVRFVADNTGRTVLSSCWSQPARTPCGQDQAERLKHILRAVPSACFCIPQAVVTVPKVRIPPEPSDVVAKAYHFLCRIHLWFRWMGWSAGKVDDVTACRIQDGGYALLWQRYDNNKMAAIFYIFNSTVID